VATIDQGITLLTGIAAGERNEEGDYPEGTVNHLVEWRLKQMAKRQLELSALSSPEGRHV
jgi:hypothetical protein